MEGVGRLGHVEEPGLPSVGFPAVSDVTSERIEEEMAQTAVVTDVTETDFATKVLEASRSRAVVVDFWAPWCGPCRQLSPLLERVAARHAGDVAVVKLNVDEAPALAQHYRVQGIPAVKAFRDGAVVAEFTGAQPEHVVERFFAGLVPSRADRLVAAAGAAGADGEDRERLLREALADDPGHAGAVVGLARVLAGRGELRDAQALLERAPGDTEAKRLRAELDLGVGAAAEQDLAALREAAATGDGAARVEYGSALAARGDHEEALASFVRAARDPVARDEARDRALAVFALLGDDHELVRTWRPRLASALF